MSSICCTGILGFESNYFDAFSRRDGEDPDGTRSRLLSTPVVDRGGSVASRDLRFASAVAAFALVLRNSDNKGQASFDMVLALAREAGGEDPEGYRAEFISMVERARTLSGVLSFPLVGQVAEWLKASVSKTGIPARVSWVRIPPCPFAPPSIPPRLV